jgi:hypothetical protein
MSATTEKTAGATAIRPFTIPVTPDTELEALRARITATRWPDPEIVTDFSQGVQQAVMAELACYWATEYDLRRYEARLSALPNFVTSASGRARGNDKFDLLPGSAHVSQWPLDRLRCLSTSHCVCRRLGSQSLGLSLASGSLFELESCRAESHRR